MLRQPEVYAANPVPHQWVFAGRKQDNMIEEILYQTQPCISTHPGFLTLEFCGVGNDGGKPFIRSHPVLGWRVDGETALHPLLFDRSSVRITGVTARLNSSGNVQDFSGSMCNDRDAWFQDVLSQHRKALEMRGAAKQHSSIVEL